MPLILAPSFDDHTRQQVEEHLDMVRVRRLSAALEYAQGRMIKLEKEDGNLKQRLDRNYDQLGKSLKRLDTEIEKVKNYLNACQMLRQEVDLVQERIELAKR